MKAFNDLYDYFYIPLDNSIRNKYINHSKKIVNNRAILHNISL